MRHLPTEPSPDAWPHHPFEHHEQRELFLRLVREHLGRHGDDVQMRGSYAAVAGQPWLHGLGNLAQMCQQRPIVDWPQVIADHLGRSEPERVLPAITALLGSGFDEIAGQLALRLHGEDYVHGREQYVVFRSDLPRTVTVLVLDLPGSMMAVPAGLLEHWNKPREQLFASALQNVAAMPMLPWQRMSLADGVELDVLVGGHDYTTTHALRLCDCLPRRGRHGNLIAIPNRQVMLSHPIDGGAMLRVTSSMLQVALGMFREGPGSITPHLFWHRPDGGFEVQQGIGRGKPQLAASPAFARLLRRLHGGQR